MNPNKLKHLLIISFTGTGEEGCDAGALRKEFFEDSLREVNERLFEGENNQRIPRKDVSLECSFEVAGILLAHSLIHGGPGMPCLSSSLFDYLATSDYAQCFPTKYDIPLNISTHELITFIEKVSCCCFFLAVVLITISIKFEWPTFLFYYKATYILLGICFYWNFLSSWH